MVSGLATTDTSSSNHSSGASSSGSTDTGKVGTRTGLYLMDYFSEKIFASVIKIFSLL